jgi:L-asparaginase
MPNVVILTTGGTIAMRHDEASGGAVPALAGEELAISIAAPHVRMLVQELCNLPSAHFTLDTLWTIRQRVTMLAADPDVDGIVVTHGTDVLEETAILLDLTVDSEKPVVLTGAMRTASEVGYDGLANLASAIEVAAADCAWGLGTLVVLNERVHAARYVTKTDAQALDTFQSPGWGPLGRLDCDGLRIAWRVARHTIAPIALEKRVELIKLTVGMEPDPVLQAKERGARGLVLETLGGGRVPPWWLPAIRQAASADMAIVTASRCPSGRVGDRYGYAGAVRDLRALGCLSTGHLNGPKARIALMAALGYRPEGQDWRAVWTPISGGDA